MVRQDKQMASSRAVRGGRTVVFTVTLTSKDGFGVLGVYSDRDKAEARMAREIVALAGVPRGEAEEIAATWDWADDEDFPVHTLAIRHYTVDEDS
jgi:hypothetical protein